MYSICLTSTIECNQRLHGDWLEAQVEQMAMGDQNALCALYEATKAATYGFALSIVKNRHDAEDILQETYIRIYAGSAAYQKNGKPMAWIFTIVRNLSLMKLRDKKRISPMEEEDWTMLPADEAEVTPEDRLVLQAAMQALSDEERQIVMLHAVTGFKHREIAELLQIPLSTVLSKYHRAMKKMKTKITEGM